MRSAVINRPSQLKLDWEPGLVETHRSLRDCIAAGVYRRGLSATAIDLNEAPGNLSVQLSESEVRHFSVDRLELYLEKTSDFTPIYYLVEKFLADRTAKQDAATAQLIAAFAEVQAAMKKAGIV